MAKVKVNFGVEVPTQTRNSKYDELYELLRSRPNEWADATEAIIQLAEASAGGKVPTMAGAAITMRKHDGFEATSRKVEGVDRLFVGYFPDGIPEEAS